MEYNSQYYGKDDPVSIYPLKEYDFEKARAAILGLLSPLGFLDSIKPKTKIAVKANLVSAMKPEESATTHPVLLSALCSLLLERGAEVVVGDSPGGLYNSAFVSRVYRVSGALEVEKYGARLNADFGERRAVFDRAKVLKTFTYTSYLDDADIIINFSKLKSHGMMGMSCAAKNMFGAVPGVIKPEYHYRFPRYEDFADMLIDLNEYFHPQISITDAVVGMEGNGPTAGTPRPLGFLLASRSPHNLDFVAAHILGFAREELPLLNGAYLRGMIYENFEDLKLIGSYEEYKASDFERVVERRSLEFAKNGGAFKRFLGKVAAKILKTRPSLKADMCVGCGVCRDICPAKAIVIEDKKAKINRKSCIRCFCCQEFCPKSAMKVKRTFIAELFHSEKKKK